MITTITVEILEFCNAKESDYLFFLKNGYEIIGNHFLLNRMVCAGYANFINGTYTQNWKTKYWR